MSLVVVGLGGEWEGGVGHNGIFVVFGVCQHCKGRVTRGK